MMNAKKMDKSLKLLEDLLPNLDTKEAKEPISTFLLKLNK